jgi:hypothetical protein
LRFRFDGALVESSDGFCKMKGKKEKAQIFMQATSHSFKFNSSIYSIIVVLSLMKKIQAVLSECCSSTLDENKWEKSTADDQFRGVKIRKGIYYSTKYKVISILRRDSREFLI